MDQVAFRLAEKDEEAKFITYFIFSVIITVLILTSVILVKVPHIQRGYVVLLSIICATIVLATLASFLFAPRLYIINRDDLKVRRVIGDIVIPLNHIAKIGMAGNPRLDREFGNEGLFAYYGAFRDEDGRRVRVYATTFKRMVRIETTDGKIFYLSPAEPERFVEAVKQRLQKRERTISVGDGGGS
ncbi:PH domain-containing protein [Desulfothermobacter acidiphilus]|uniref:PH domain-containing protein n=1 Tax=Desulfothermobacter acidiphilus TaxID=1938353 RepID=UPI003F8C691F